MPLIRKYHDRVAKILSASHMAPTSREALYRAFANFFEEDNVFFNRERFRNIVFRSKEKPDD